MDNSNRKVSTAETILKNITQERDSAVSQLGVAYFTIEQLKVENEGLKEENDKLKTRLGQLTSDYENETQKWTTKEEALRRKLDRRTDRVRSMIEESGVQHPKLQDKTVSKAFHTESIDPNIEYPTRKDANTIFDLHPGRKDMGEASKSGQRTVQIEDSQDSEDSMYEAPKAKEIGKFQSPRRAKVIQATQADETSQNLTYLSFLEVKLLLLLSS